VLIYEQAVGWCWFDDDKPLTTIQKIMAENIPQDMPPSAQMMQMVFGYMTSQAISVAAKFGLADQLKDGPRTVEDLAQATGLHARALYRLMRALASVGVFAEDADGRFQLTPLAEVLRSDAPDSLRAFSIFWGADWHLSVWGNLPYSIQTGQPAFEKLNGKAFFDHLGENPAQAQIFNNAMTGLSLSASMAVVAAYDFSSITKLVDVGGGHGLMLSAILEKYPQMQGVVFDAPSVIEGAQALLGKPELTGRCEAVAGDFFKSVPADCDGYIMKHIIHDWDDERALTILRNCRAAMKEGGKLMVVEMVIPEGNTPSPGKFLDLEMLLFLHSFERTEAEYRSLYEQAGFELTRVVPTSSPYSVIEGVCK